MKRVTLLGLCLGCCLFAVQGSAQEIAPVDSLPPLDCTPEQTGGFHDYPGGEEIYEGALFHPSPFGLEENLIFMLNLGGEEGAPDLYLTMTMEYKAGDGSVTPNQTELECRRVRGVGGSVGYSCVNLPPSEMLLINASTFRFTRTAVGGWTFAGAADKTNGDSIFVEYGQCVTRQQPASRAE